jgi:hypothetical protein
MTPEQSHESNDNHEKTYFIYLQTRAQEQDLKDKPEDKVSERIFTNKLSRRALIVLERILFDTYSKKYTHCRPSLFQLIDISDDTRTNREAGACAERLKESPNHKLCHCAGESDPNGS